MALIVTPRQLSQRAEFYYQLGSLLSAGVTLMQALETQHRNPPDRSFREPVRRILEQLKQGYTFGDAVERAGAWLTSFDVALLRAAEQSGRLDACFKMMSGYYRERAQLAKSVISDLAYPLFVFHFAIFIMPFPQWFATGNTALYALKTLGVLLPLYAALVMFLYACQGKHGEQWRATVESFAHCIPILGKARRELAIARLSAALEALISAGVGIIEAWELASAGCGSPALRRVVKSWKPRLLAGETPSAAVSQAKEFPELFANLYHSGEVSGKLDESLLRLNQHFQEEGTRKLRAVAQWAPRFVFFAVMLLIAYQVVSFYSNYFNQIGDAMK